VRDERSFEIRGAVQCHGWALAAKIPGVGFTADVTVVSDWKLSATIATTDGRRLAEQRHVVMDAKLSATSFERFANALATKVAALPPANA
jgi:hypothetical protein